MATHPPWNQEYRPVKSDVYNKLERYFQIGQQMTIYKGHTKTVKGEYCSVEIEHRIDNKTFESRSSIFQVYNLAQQAFQ